MSRECAAQADGLAAHECRIKGDIHTMIENAAGWTVQQYETPRPGHAATWRDRDVFVYYKGRVVVHLKQQKHFLVEDRNLQQRYGSLAEVVAAYQQSSRVALIERSEREEEIKTWCQEQRPNWNYLFFRVTSYELEALERLLEDELHNGERDERETLEGLAKRMFRQGLKAFQQDKRTCR